MVRLKEIRSLLFSIIQSPEGDNSGLVPHDANKYEIILSCHSTIFSAFLLIASWLQYGYSTSSLIFSYQARKKGKITMIEGQKFGYFAY